MPVEELSPAATTFILHWGEMGTRWGVNRTVAQVHALLYLSPDPLTAEDIADQLAVARSNVSNSLKELQNWNLVHIVPRLGDRRDFFHTSHDVWQLFLTVIDQRVERELAPTLTMLRTCAEQAKREKSPQTSTQIKAMATFFEDTMAWYTQMKSIPPASLRALMRLGSGITRWLPKGKRS